MDAARKRLRESTDEVGNPVGDHVHVVSWYDHVFGEGTGSLRPDEGAIRALLLLTGAAACAAPAGEQRIEGHVRANRRLTHIRRYGDHLGGTLVTHDQRRLANRALTDIALDF